MCSKVLPGNPVHGQSSPSSTCDSGGLWQGLPARATTRRQKRSGGLIFPKVGTLGEIFRSSASRPSQGSWPPACDAGAGVRSRIALSKATGPEDSEVSLEVRVWSEARLYCSDIREGCSVSAPRFWPVSSHGVFEGSRPGVAKVSGDPLFFTSISMRKRRHG